MKLSGSLLIPKENLFYFCLHLNELSENLLDGFAEQEFTPDEEKNSVSWESLHESVVCASALLIDEFSDTVNRELSEYMTKKHGIAFGAEEDGYVFEPTHRVLSDGVARIRVPKKVLFQAFAELQQYDEFEEDSDPADVHHNIDTHAFLCAQMHGRLRFENARKIILDFIGTRKQLEKEFSEYAQVAHIEASELWT